MTFEEKKQRLADVWLNEALLFSRIKELNELKMLLGSYIDRNLELKIQKEMREFQSYVQQVREAINELPKEQQLVLRLRYLEHMTWEDVANTMKCCRAKTFIVHDKAVNNLHL